MRTLKKAVCISFVVLILFSFTACQSTEDAFGALAFFSMIMSSDDSVPKDKIIEFVNEHQDELRECAEKNDFSEFEGRGIVKSVYDSETHTKFYCGGRGLAAGPSYYCGFFYSPHDSATAMWPHLTVSPEENGFVYEEANGNNRFYSEEIFDCFFYYEQSY